MHTHVPKRFFFQKKKIFVVIEQRRQHIKHTKESKHLTLCEHTSTPTHMHKHAKPSNTHTHARTHARKHALGPFKLCNVKTFFLIL